MAEEPPEVIASFPQPLSGGPSNKAPEYSGRPQYIVFIGKQGEQEKLVEVLADEAAPTPSAGYAKWIHVPRPQRTALTVLEGYEPFSLSVPVLFDAVRENNIRENVEFEIQKLEWMGGRGILAEEPGVGKPPLVQVFSVSNKTRSNELIPKPFQTSHIRWYVDDITWDEHPLRSTGGARIRQAAVVKLVQYVTISPATKGSTGPKYKTFQTNKSLNTVKKLVRHHMNKNLLAKGDLNQAVKETMAANKGNKAIGTNPEKPLKNGTKVLVPRSVL